MKTDSTAKEIMHPGVSNMMVRCCGFFLEFLCLSGKRSKACCLKSN